LDYIVKIDAPKSVFVSLTILDYLSNLDKQTCRSRIMSTYWHVMGRLRLRYANWADDTFVSLFRLRSTMPSGL